jgi:hypothetical protein
VDVSDSFVDCFVPAEEPADVAAGAVAPGCGAFVVRFMPAAEPIGAEETAGAAGVAVALGCEPR